MSREQLARSAQLRALSMQMVLRLADLDVAEARFVLDGAAELLKYMHSPPGVNAPLGVVLDGPQPRRVS